MHLKTSLIAAIFVLILPSVFGARTWYQKAAIGGDARHRCTAFSIGNKGYVGGGHINSGTEITYKDYWEYDPATNTWTQIADFGGGLRYHSSAFTIGSYAYVGCGENATDEYTNDMWKYVPEVNTWYPVANFPGSARRGAATFVIDGKGYLGIGQSDGGYESDFYEYDPSSDSWIEIAPFIGESRSSAVAFSNEGIGYIGTGHIVGSATNDFFAYDQASNTWTEKAAVGTQIRQDAMGFCIDGKAYIGTGNDNNTTDFKDIWEYDFVLDSWQRIADFTGEKRRYAVTFTINNTVYLGGGTNGTNFKDFWAYAPPVSIKEELNHFDFSIYPTPSTTWVNFHLKSSDQTDIYYRITDIYGKEVQKGLLNQMQHTIHKEDIGNGIFFINLIKNEQTILNRKFIFN